MKYREVVTYKEYFDDFFKKQSRKVQDKIIKVLDILETVEQIPATFFKIQNGLLFFIEHPFFNDISINSESHFKKFPQMYVTDTWVFLQRACDILHSDNIFRIVILNCLKVTELPIYSIHPVKFIGYL